MSEEIPQWAFERVCEITNADGSTYCVSSLTAKSASNYSIGKAFARYIAAHEEAPVDPLEAEAEKFAESWTPTFVTSSARFFTIQQLALAALKRGIELASKP